MTSVELVDCVAQACILWDLHEEHILYQYKEIQKFSFKIT